MSFFEDIKDFFEDLGDKFRSDYHRRSREDRALDYSDTSSSDEEEHPKVLEVDFLAKENSLQHHTEEYELVDRKPHTAIIRRGASFFVEIKINVDVNLKKSQELKIYFNFGPRPMVMKGTQAVLTLSGKRLFDKEKDEWDHRVVKESGKTVKIEIFVPHDVPVGVWFAVLEIRNRPSGGTEATKKHIFRPEDMLYILFNAWVKDDDVYLKDDTKRSEYILNEVGQIWMGAGRPRDWMFGQFDHAVLPACILLLEKAGINYEQRGDPIVICRAISKIVNSNEDNGVIAGKWHGGYEGGKDPSYWTGSIAILEQYMRTNKPVLYGQCWVFSGVTTTVCRALGIPCRSVTTYNSAHDTNKSLTIDKYYEKNGQPVKAKHAQGADGVGDSIWNYHVWNDVWMTRPDLPDGHGGWQAIDATPQELSHGIHQCGPASLQAVKKGETHLKYDVDFVMAEVNADVVYWLRDDQAQDGFRRTNSGKDIVGSQMITKKVVSKEEHTVKGEDVVYEYKPPERSNAERVTLHTAARRTRAARHAFRFPSVVDEDIEMKLAPFDTVMIGNDFKIEVNIKNLSPSKRTVAIYIYAYSEYYNGVKGELIEQREGKVVMKGSEDAVLPLLVTYDKYFGKLVEHALVKIVALATVEETSQAWNAEYVLEIAKPSIKIENTGNATVGKGHRIKLSFTNPLDRPLSKCILIVDGPGLTRPKQIPIDNVDANSEMVHEMKLYPKKSGRKTLICTFNSDHLVNMCGSTTINVAD